jgi:UDPglucose 6-dehydrogenase
MNVGFIGLGKLGLPCALVMDNKGHNVYGYDINPQVEEILESCEIPYREAGTPELLKNHDIKWSSVSEVVSNSEIIFVPIQTPHDERFEGTTRIPEDRVDFDYTYLKSGMKTLADEIARQGDDKIVIIISTVLPGTIRKEIKPLLNDHVKLCYNPFFIAMGTTRHDFENPEFILFGMDDDDAYTKATELYATIHDKPVYKCTIEEAEMIKVTYNTYITMKICLANVVMEASHKLENVNCDNVMKGLFLGTDRLMSPKYLLGGMGDGGGCHPRDNIALSWMARKLNMSYDWYESLMVCREDQTDWLADLIVDHRGDMPVTILGKCFKKETNLTVGSPSILLKNLLEERGEQVDMYDPWVDEEHIDLTSQCYFIGTNHDKFLDYKFPKGSVVIDPWRMIEEQDGITLISVGKS